MAFDNLNTRTNSEGIRAVVNTLQQTAKFGTPLAQSLRVLAAEMRTARMTRAEEKAARFVQDRVTKPVIAYIAGFSAPPGKTMGHAGAIISGSSGTAQAKKEALEAAGIQVGTTPTEVAQLVAERFGART